MYPKLVALDTDWTIFWGNLDVNTWGKGAGASPSVEDNIEKIDYWDIRDRTNHNLKCGMYADVPDIIKEILENGAKLAIVSSNRHKGMCDRALWYWTVPDAQGNQKPLIDLVEFDEVYASDGEPSKNNHFEKIKGWTNFDYSDMILYDDEAIYNDVEITLGVTFQVCRDEKGLTWDNYRHGLEMWRRNKAIRSPWLGPNIDPYKNKILLGYSGMDIDSIKLLEKGERRIDKKEAQRWGYAMYITDDLGVAKFFNDWIKTNANFGETVVCAIYARDKSIFDELPKIWIPEDTSMMTGNQNTSQFDIAWSQENRDRQVESWGVQKPYILFSRHHDMGHTVPVNGRFNEMVVYGQIQEGLILTVQMSGEELANAVADRERHHLHYEQKMKEWNITVPNETRDDFRNKNEQF